MVTSVNIAKNKIQTLELRKNTFQNDTVFQISSALPPLLAKQKPVKPIVEKAPAVKLRSSEIDSSMVIQKGVISSSGFPVITYTARDPSNPKHRKAVQDSYRRDGEMAFAFWKSMGKTAAGWVKPGLDNTVGLTLDVLSQNHTEASKKISNVWRAGKSAFKLVLKANNNKPKVVLKIAELVFVVPPKAIYEGVSIAVEKSGKGDHKGAASALGGAVAIVPATFEGMRLTPKLVKGSSTIVKNGGGKIAQGLDKIPAVVGKPLLFSNWETLSHIRRKALLAETLKAKGLSLQQLYNLAKLDNLTLNNITDLLKKSDQLRKANTVSNIKNHHLIKHPAPIAGLLEHGPTFPLNRIGTFIGAGYNKKVSELINTFETPLVVAADKKGLKNLEADINSEVKDLGIIKNMGIPTISHPNTMMLEKGTGIKFAIRAYFNPSLRSERVMIMEAFPTGSKNSKHWHKMSQAEWDSKISTRTLEDLILIRQKILKSNKSIRDTQYMLFPDGKIILFDPLYIKDGINYADIKYLDAAILQVKKDMERIKTNGKSRSTLPVNLSKELNHFDRQLNKKIINPLKNRLGIRQRAL